MSRLTPSFVPMLCFLLPAVSCWAAEQTKAPAIDSPLFWLRRYESVSATVDWAKVPSAWGNLQSSLTPALLRMDNWSGLAALYAKAGSGEDFRAAAAKALAEEKNTRDEDRDVVAAVHSLLAACCMRFDDRQGFEEHMRLMREMVRPDRLDNALASVISELCASGHFDDAVRVARGITSTGFRGSTLGNIAEVQFKAGLKAESARTLEAADMDLRASENFATSPSGRDYQRLERGELLVRCGELKRAEELAPSLKPDQQTALLCRLAEAYHKAGNNDDCARCLAMARLAAGQDDMSRASLVWGYNSCNNIDGLHSLASQVLSEEPRRGEVFWEMLLFDLAEKLVAVKQDELALSLLRWTPDDDSLRKAEWPELLTKLDASELVAGYRIVKAIAASGRPEKAIALAEKLPDCAGYAKVLLAVQLAEAGHFDEAADMAQALDLTLNLDRARALSSVLSQWIATGKFQDILTYANSRPERWMRCEILGGVAQSLMNTRPSH